MSSRDDYFTSYLKTVREPEADVGTSLAAGPDQVGPLELLKVLRTSGAEPVSKLQALSGLPFTRFAAIVNTLEEAGLVTMNGDPGTEVIEITTAGEKLSEIA